MSHRLIARTGLTACIALLTLAMLVLARPAFTSTRPAAEIGKSAPHFTLPATTGHPIALPDYQGQTLILFFGSDHCPLSQAYSDKILTLANKYASSPAPVKFLAINSNPNRLPGSNPSLCNSLSIPTLIDPDARVARLYGVPVTPTFCLIDPAGILRYAGSFDDGSNPSPRQYLAEALRHVVDAVPFEVTSTRPFGRQLLPAP